MALITLTTDFGPSDSYVGAMKGVILSIAPQVSIIDIAHQIPAQDIIHGAFVISEAAAFFPPRTIHVAVVDPGVGSNRHPLCLECRGQYFLGPDNGLFSLVVSSHPWLAWRIENKRYMNPVVSNTFQGRDLFAPAAAHLALGVPPQELGPPVSQLQELRMPPIQRSRKALQGEVIHIDHFGNAITNIRYTDLPSHPSPQIRIQAGRKILTSIHRIYEDVGRGEAAALIASSGFLEIAVRNGSAAKKLSLKRGSPVKIGFKDFG